MPFVIGWSDFPYKISVCGEVCGPQNREINVLQKFHVMYFESLYFGCLSGHNIFSWQFKYKKFIT